jgi:hypothetical protein
VKKVLFVFFAVVFFAGCADIFFGIGEGLVKTPRTPPGSAFTIGGYEYVKAHLRVSTFIDRGGGQFGYLTVEYGNDGDEGILLKTECRWGAGGENYYGAPEKYSAFMPPYSRYVIRKRISKAIHGGQVFSCDHFETFSNIGL